METQKSTAQAHGPIVLNNKLRPNALGRQAVIEYNRKRKGNELPEDLFERLEGTLNSIGAIEDSFLAAADKISEDRNLTPAGKIKKTADSANQWIEQLGRLEKITAAALDPEITEIQRRISDADIEKGKAADGIRLLREMRHAEIRRSLAGKDALQVGIVYRDAFRDAQEEVMDAIEGSPIPLMGAKELDAGKVSRLERRYPEASKRLEALLDLKTIFEGQFKLVRKTLGVREEAQIKI